MDNFSKGSTAVDLAWSAHAFEGGNNSYNFGINHALGDNWAVNYRQTSYAPNYESAHFDAKNRELNLIHKINNNLQLYAGYSRTNANNEIKDLEKNVF